MTLTLEHPTTPADELGRMLVAALIVTDTTAVGLASVVDAVGAQTQRPDRIVVVDRLATALPDLADRVVARVGDVPVEVIEARSRSLRHGVRAAVSALGDPGQWAVWIMPAGATAASGALADLADDLQRSTSVGMVGPKLVDAADPGRLRGIGISATRTGRVIPDPVDGASDQGQYDQRLDVLAVPVVGALVEATLVDRLRGWDEGFGPLGSDLDFGWRAQRLGRRVLVRPETEVRVAAGPSPTNATTARQRRAARRVALARASWWGAPLLALWIVVSAIGGALALLIAKRPRAAWSTLGDLLALDPVSVLRARWRTRGPGPVRRSELGGLFVSGAEVRRGWVDSVHHAVAPGRGSLDAGPTELRTSTATAILTHPLVPVGLLVLVAYAAAGRSLGTGVLGALRGGFTGGELIGGPISASALWQAWLGPWRGAGLGADTDLVGGPHLALLAVPTWILEHLPGSSGLQSPGGVVIALLLLVGPLLASIGAYLSARVVTPARWPRAAAAMAWAVAGVAGTAYAQGRLGAVVAHVLLAPVLAGLVLLARRGGTATTAFATALGAAVLGAFAPLLLVVVAVLSLGIIVFGPSAGARRRALAPLLVPVLLLGPWVLVVREDPRRLVAGPGLTDWAATGAAPWENALLQLTSVADRPSLVAPVIAVALLAVVGLSRASRLGSIETATAVLTVISLALVSVLGRVTLAQPSEGVIVRPWLGLPMLVLWLALLAGALLQWAPGAQPTVRASRVRVASGVLLSLAALASGGVLVVNGIGDSLRSWVDPRPAVAVEHAQGDAAGRTLFIAPGPQGAAYRLMGREVADVARSLPLDRADDAALAPAVSSLLDGDPRGGAGLNRYAVGAVAMVEDADPALTRAMDATEGLTRLVARDGWNYWRVSAAGPDGARPVAPPRLWIESEGASTLVPTTGVHAATSTSIEVGAPTVLHVAEPADWARTARVRWQGNVVAADVTNDVPTYRLGPGTGRLEIEALDPLRPWRLAQYALNLVIVFLAVPFGTRASRSRR